MFWLTITTAFAAVLACILAGITLFTRRRPSPIGPEVAGRLTGLEPALKEMPVTVREEGRLLREELRGGLSLSLLSRHQRGVDRS